MRQGCEIVFPFVPHVGRLIRGVLGFLKRLAPFLSDLVGQGLEKVGDGEGGGKGRASIGLVILSA